LDKSIKPEKTEKSVRTPNSCYKKGNLIEFSPLHHNTMNRLDCLLLSCFIFSCLSFEFQNEKVKDDSHDVIKFWTRERMLNAKPMDLPILQEFKTMKSNSSTKATTIVNVAYSTMPYKAAGRIFFNTATGGASCSYWFFF
jgi:hypothetical protein